MEYHFTAQHYKRLLSWLTYIGMALLLISDHGVQVFLLVFCGNFGISSRILRMTAFCLLFTKVLGTRYTKKEYLLLMGTFFISFYSYTKSNNLYGIYNVLVIASLKDIDFTKFFQMAFWTVFLTILCLGILSFLGIGYDLSMTQDFGRGSIETRYCFGFGHANIWHQAVSRCMVFFVLGYRQKLYWPHFLGLLAINYLAYTFSVSRTGLLATWAFLILCLCYQYFPKLFFHPIIRTGTVFGMSFLYFAFFQILQGYYHEINARVYWIDVHLTNCRISQGLERILANPISLWGHNYTDSKVFDCGILRMLYEYGWIQSLLLVLACALLFLWALKKKKGDIIALCVFMAFYSFYEAAPATRASYNLTIFLLAYFLFRGSSQESL